MAKDLFDLDDSLTKSKGDYSEQLKKANNYCIRELYDKALDIYNSIIDEDMDNEEAYIGILKVHSEVFTKYDGEQIEKDVRIIERLFPEIDNKEYLNYLVERKKATASKTIPVEKPVTPQSSPAPKVETKQETKKDYEGDNDYRTPLTDELEAIFNNDGSTLPLAYGMTIEEDFSLSTFNKYKKEYLEWDGVTDFGPKGIRKHNLYFFKVYSNSNAPMQYRVQAAHYYGFISYHDARYDDALGAYKFAALNIAADPTNKGNCINNAGLMYFNGKSVPVDEERAKKVWLLGKKYYNNELCIKHLKQFFNM